MFTTDMSEQKSNGKRRSNLTLWLVLAVCLFPFIGSIALYLFWRPDSFVNYGDLVQPVVPLAEVVVQEQNGSQFRFEDLHGKWVFLMVDNGDCDDYCQMKLYWMRQVRLTQGPDQERIERLWLVRDGKRPRPEVLNEHAGTREVLIADSTILAKLPGYENAADYLYVVDPLGNLMMRYPRDLDPSRMKKDVSKLLRISKGWREVSR